MPAEEGHAEDIYEGQSQERSFDFFAELIAANAKRTYDEYQGVNLDQTRALNNIALQALQNAVESANMVSKQVIKHNSDTDAQKVRHADIAIENQWESSTEISGEAVIAALAAAVAEAFKKNQA